VQLVGSCPENSHFLPFYLFLAFSRAPFKVIAEHNPALFITQHFASKVELSLFSFVLLLSFDDDGGDTEREDFLKWLFDGPWQEARKLYSVMELLTTTPENRTEFILNYEISCASVEVCFTQAVTFFFFFHLLFFCLVLVEAC